MKHLEIIGEAVYMLSKEFKDSHAEVDWRVTEGVRHVLVHGYHQIKPQQLWGTLETDITELKPFIDRYMEEADNGGRGRASRCGTVPHTCLGGTSAPRP